MNTSFCLVFYATGVAHINSKNRDKMCLFWLIRSVDTNIYVRKEPELCKQGMIGKLCIDSKKIQFCGHRDAAYTTRPDIFICTNTEVTMVLENMIRSHEVLIEYKIIEQYMKMLDGMSAREVYDFYLQRKKLPRDEQLKGPREIKVPDHLLVKNEFKSTPGSNTSKSSQKSHKSYRKILPPNSVAPSDSVSQVSTKALGRIEELGDDEATTIIGDWVRASSIISTKTSATASTAMTGVSTASSRRSSSRNLSKQMMRINT